MTERKELFTGFIAKRQRQKVYHKNSEFYQQINYKLVVKSCEEELTVFAYANMLTKPIFSTIEQGTYLAKKYLFTVKKRK